MARREGATGEPLASRFAALRVCAVRRDAKRLTPKPEVWLMVEWPDDEDEPTKYWLSNLPADTALSRLVYPAKQRWLIERDYQELKQELGLGHYEGRGWPGFHHHAAPPIRPERHQPGSIATLHRPIEAALIGKLSRCPCCLQKIPTPNRAVSNS